MPAQTGDDSIASLRFPEFRYLLASIALSTLAGRALNLVIGYQIYELTGDPLAIAWLGLVEVIPAVSLALFGGHVADRNDRRRIVLVTMGASVLCAVLLMNLAPHTATLGVLPLYGVIFLAGIARGFADPAASAFEAQVVPRELYVNASAWLSSMWQGCAIIGPAAGGLIYFLIGDALTYLTIAILFALSWLFIWLIAPKPVPEVIAGESVFESIAVGLRFVFSNQVLVGSMALDLFAVLFGGAMALLPIFAKDILHVGSLGAGVMSAAPSIGALLVMLWSTHRPPIRHAGRNLLLCVGGFGISMIVFAFSQHFWLSLAALAFSGGFDGVSVVIRKSILRILSPDHMRGRISAVGSIFISSSNELGAFESGVAAKLLGAARSVWVGGLVTLAVVFLAAVGSPKLRSLNLTDPKYLANEPPS